MHVIRLSSVAPGLEQYVRFYAHQEAQLGNASLVQPIPARATPLISFIFGDPHEVHWCDCPKVETSPRTVIVGLQTYRRVRLRLTGTVESFVIFFQPTGLNRMFSLPMPELTNRDHEARAVLGIRIQELEQRLGESKSFEERVQIADTYLLRHCLTLPKLAGLSAAAMTILHCRGDIEVPTLAHRAGVSTRQFERRFKREVGVSPKLYARIARFEAALECKALSTSDSWTDVAHHLGYFDQMHLIHDFKEFSGDIPTNLLTQLETNYDAHLDGIRSGQISPTRRRAPQLIL
jgi:AraC-like DNA-binding protein